MDKEYKKDKKKIRKLLFKKLDINDIKNSIYDAFIIHKNYEDFRMKISDGMILGFDDIEKYTSYETESDEENIWQDILMELRNEVGFKILNKVIADLKKINRCLIQYVEPNNVWCGYCWAKYHIVEKEDEKMYKDWDDYDLYDLLKLIEHKTEEGKHDLVAKIQEYTLKKWDTINYEEVYGETY